MLLSAINPVDNASNGKSIETIRYPKHSHNQDPNKPFILLNGEVPVGFSLDDQNAVHIDDISSLRFRRDDLNILKSVSGHNTSDNHNIMKSSHTIDEYSLSTIETESQSIHKGMNSPNDPVNTNPVCFIDAVYFPLMSILLPRWLSLINASSSERKTRRKIIILITGRGTPMDKKAKIIDNSTKYTGIGVVTFRIDFQIVICLISLINIGNYLCISSSILVVKT